MRRSAIQVSAAMLAAAGLTLGLPLAQHAQAAPAKAPVEVTYYYLPG
jgi:hypothetical protein